MNGIFGRVQLLEMKASIDTFVPTHMKGPFEGRVSSGEDGEGGVSTYGWTVSLHLVPRVSKAVEHLQEISMESREIL